MAVRNYHPLITILPISSEIPVISPDLWLEYCTRQILASCQNQFLRDPRNCGPWDTTLSWPPQVSDLQSTRSWKNTVWYCHRPWGLETSPGRPELLVLAGPSSLFFGVLPQMPGWKQHKTAKVFYSLIMCYFTIPKMWRCSISSCPESMFEWCMVIR